MFYVLVYGVKCYIILSNRYLVVNYRIDDTEVTSVRWQNDGCGRNTHLITDVTQRDAKEFELVALNCVQTARKGQTQETDDLWPDDLASVACEITLVRVFESPAGPPFTVRERFISRHSPLPYYTAGP